MTDLNYRQRSSYRVKRLFQTLRARVDEALDPLGLSMPQYGALTVLQAEGRLSNAALARLNFVTPQTMLRIVGGLEAGGFITRDPSSTGKSIQFQVSETGHLKLEEAHALVTKIERQMVGGLAPDTAALFLQSLDRCAETLAGGSEAQ